MQRLNKENIIRRQVNISVFKETVKTYFETRINTDESVATQSAPETKSRSNIRPAPLGHDRSPAVLLRSVEEVQ